MTQQAYIPPLQELKASQLVREQPIDSRTQVRPSQLTIAWGKVVSIHRLGGAAWTDFPTDLAYPQYCIVNPSTAAGTSVVTGITLYVLLNFGLAVLPTVPNGIITATNAIVGYLPGSGGAIRTGTTPFDGVAVLGMGCWIDWARARNVV